MIRFFVSVCFVFILSGLFSQTDSISDQQIDEVKVVTRITPANSLSGTLTQVLKGEDIQRIGIQSLSDAVRRFAGVSVKDYGGIGGLKTVSIRGLGAQHTAISYDGITIGNTQLGQVDIGQFSLDNVSLLSLSIGQSDNIFQSARHFASAGVLDIKTNIPNFNKNNYEGKINVKTGSFGYFNPSALYAHKISEQWAISANADWKRADGNYRFKYDNGAIKEKRRRRNSDVNIWNTELNVYGNLKKNGTLRLKAYYFDSERGLPTSTISVNQYTSERLYDKNFFSQANYENKLSDKFSVQGLSKFSRYYNKYTYKSATLGKNGLQTDRYTQFEYYFSGSILYKPIDILSFSLAQDYAHNRLHIGLETKRIENEVPKVSDLRYYAHRNTLLTALNAKLKTNKITLTGGLLSTHVTNEHDKGSVPKNLKRFSPSFSLSYKPFDLGLRFRMSYKDIFRVPSFNDIYYTGIGDRSLKPEKTKQYNVGTTYFTGTSSALQFISVSVDGYINKVKDKIILLGQNSYYWSMVNMGSVTIKGVDVAISGELTLSSKFNLLLNAAYGYQDAKEDDTDKRPTYTPKHFGNLSVGIENPWLNFTYSLVTADKRYSDITYLSKYRLDAYFDHSISVNKTIKIKNNNLRLQGELLNIAGKNYEVVRLYPMPGRSFRVMAAYSF